MPTANHDLKRAWRTHAQAHRDLLLALPDGGLAARAASGGMTVAQHFVHCHAVRLHWADRALGGVPQARPSDATSTRDLAAALQESEARIDEVFTHAQEGGAVRGFPGTAVDFLAYLVSHESHHRGQILLALKQSSRPLSAEAAMALWRSWWSPTPNG